MLSDANEFMLPSIKSVRGNKQIGQSPFKGYLDTSAFSQRVRQTSKPSEQIHVNDNTAIGKLFKNNKFEKAAVKMNSKVLETWINETLQDAEHLDIPGVILKPEHKNPISRYGIDRLTLTNSGIPNEMVDRIFRALFVYSVGFYELIKKCLEHTEKRYTIITSLWKVYSILLEYCCRSDYRMLISEISKEHKEELEKLEGDFNQKFMEQANNEKIFKQNMEILQKYTEELEKERTNERTMRLKLEEEYMQNTKNHEEEVQLRLKFESKLNNMHSVHRDLESQYQRAINDIAGLQNTNSQLSEKLALLTEEVAQLKIEKAENDSKIIFQNEKIISQKREVDIKNKQVTEYEERYKKAQDELDITNYKLQETGKDLTEQKLKLDVSVQEIESHKHDKSHLELELKETKELQQVYQQKSSQLFAELSKLNVDYQKSKKEVVGFDEILKERDDRIDKLKEELKKLKADFQDLDIKAGTLTVTNQKQKEHLDTLKLDHEDVIDKLHITNKARHETEIKLQEALEKIKHLNKTVNDKDEMLAQRATEIDDSEKKIVGLTRTVETLEIKKAGLERVFEQTKRQLNEKLTSTNDMLNSEKETRDMWIERYEKEQREHTNTNSTLLQIRSQLKDQILVTKNAEIKMETQMKQIEVLTDSNNRLQDELNETLAKNENFDRELNTQKEILKQVESTKKEQIQKLRRDLQTVESRFWIQIDRAEMTAEDLTIQVDRLNYKLHKLEDSEMQLKLNLESSQKAHSHSEGKLSEMKRELHRIMMMREVNVSECRELHSRILAMKDEIKSHNIEEADLREKLKYINVLLIEKNELEQQIAVLNTELTKQKFNSKKEAKKSSVKSLASQVKDIGVQTDRRITMSKRESGDVSNLSSLPNSKGLRVGGGGEIRKPVRQRVSGINDAGELVVGPSGQSYSKEVSGVSAGTPSHGRQSNASGQQQVVPPLQPPLINQTPRVQPLTTNNRGQNHQGFFQEEMQQPVSDQVYPTPKGNQKIEFQGDKDTMFSTRHGGMPNIQASGISNSMSSAPMLSPDGNRNNAVAVAQNETQFNTVQGSQMTTLGAPGQTIEQPGGQIYGPEKVLMSAREQVSGQPQIIMEEDEEEKYQHIMGEFSDNVDTLRQTKQDEFNLPEQSRQPHLQLERQTHSRDDVYEVGHQTLTDGKIRNAQTDLKNTFDSLQESKSFSPSNINKDFMDKRQNQNAIISPRSQMEINQDIQQVPQRSMSHTKNPQTFVGVAQPAKAPTQFAVPDQVSQKSKETPLKQSADKSKPSLQGLTPGQANTELDPLESRYNGQQRHRPQDESNASISGYKVPNTNMTNESLVQPDAMRVNVSHPAYQLRAPNAQVKGKSSIRTLIKSAATRDEQ